MLEQFLRGFATATGGLAFTAGYPLKAKDIRGVVPENTLSLAEEIGDAIITVQTKQLSLNDFATRYDLRFFGDGVITTMNEESRNGFEIGTYTIDAGRNQFTVKFKNENIVLLQGKKVLVTAPDSIILFDVAKYAGINNFEQNINKRVAIFGRKAIPIWRTRKGKALFNPKKLGLDFAQVLL